MAEYFAYISHEPGHTIHLHVRLRCPAADKRCVGFAQGETTEADPRVRKLPPGFSGKPAGPRPTPGVLRPRAPPRTSTPGASKSKLPGAGR
jgi:murein endopeptidase